MTLEESFFATLQGVCPRVFPDTAPLETPRPYITYVQIGGDAVAYVEDTVPATRNAVYQVNYWADMRKDSTAMALAAEVAIVEQLSGRAVSALVAEPVDHDDDPRGVRQDFSVWGAR